MPSHYEWKRVVIHIEGATESLSLQERQHLLEKTFEALERGEPGPEIPSRKARFRGTAVYATYGGRRYLLTARHVLRSDQAAERIRTDDLAKVPRELQNPFVEDWIFDIIFRIPSLDEFLDGRVTGLPANLFGLRAGVTQNKTYTYSTPELDLAVISLDAQRNSWPHEAFVRELESMGQEPIELESALGDDPSAEGASLMCVGFPEAVATVERRPLTPSEQIWASAGISLPVSSFGHVAMLSPRLPFFWADISAYPGNSGGPVIENGRLVGIVSKQALVSHALMVQATGQTKPLPGVKTLVRVPFVRAIKAKLILPLIAIQAKKDAYDLAHPTF